MIIYGSLFIPFLTAFVLYRWFKHKTLLWEFLIPFVASMIFSTSAKFIIETSMVQSQEYWGSMIQRIEYYEDWNEYIEQTCSRECCCDADGQNCGTETYDCSYVLYHPEYWQIITTTGEVISISQTEYTRLKWHFGNEIFKDLQRDFHTNDGDEYYCLWNNDQKKAIPVTTLHYYENRVKVADQSIFHFQDVDTADQRKYSLKDYPPITDRYKQDAVIGDQGSDANIANRKLKYLNGNLGHKKEARVFVLVFKDQPIQAGLFQEWYWSGGNMNEFIICIGIDKERVVKWCHPISWTTNEYLKSDIRQFVISQKKLNLSSIADYTYEKIDDGFMRRDFKEFDYLTVDPPTWAVVLVYILVLGLNIGLSYWIIINEYEE